MPTRSGGLRPQASRRFRSNSRSSSVSPSLTFVALSIVCAAAPLTAQAPAACVGTWSASVPLRRDDGRPVYIERGIITELNGRTVAIGSPTQFWLDTAHLESEAMMKRIPFDTAQLVWALTRGGGHIAENGIVTAIPKPDSMTGWRRPRLLGRSAEGITVSWEGLPPATPENRDPDPTRIDIATFDGARWSRPETVVRSEREIDPKLGPPARNAAANFLDDVILSYSNVPGYRGLAMRTGTVWKSFPNGRPTTFLAGVTRLDDGTFVFIEVRADTPPQTALPPGASPRSIRPFVAVWSSRGRLSGDSVAWSAPVLVDTIAGSHNPPVWARLGKDSLFVLWKHQGDSLAPSGVRAALSPDGGRTWARVPPFEGASSAGRGSLAIDAAGRLHFAYQIPSQPGALLSPGIVMHTVFAGGRWSKPDTVTTRESFVEPGLGAISGGRVMVTWAEGHFDTNGVDLKTSIRVWSPGCAK